METLCSELDRQGRAIGRINKGRIEMDKSKGSIFIGSKKKSSSFIFHLDDAKLKCLLRSKTFDLEGQLLRSRSVGQVTASNGSVLSDIWFVKVGDIKSQYSRMLRGGCHIHLLQQT